MKKLGAFLRHEWAAVRHVAHQMEFDPETQWRFHRKMCWFWIANFLPVTVLLAGVLLTSTKTALLLTAIMLGVNTYYSLYANFDTEFDAVSAAYAAMRADAAASRIEESK
ncbi:MAG: hypothetical protein KGL39_42430 [Patescibacteria group bacterium]|nr:hypothetical protein [Patescibacteria group bacterium]